MYLVAVVQLCFLVILSFAVSRLIKLKSKVNRNGQTVGFSFFQSSFWNLLPSKQRLLDLITPSFLVGSTSHGLSLPQELFLFRNCFSFIWNSGHLLITFDPTTALLDLVTVGSEVATKSIQDDTKKESIVFDAFTERLKSSFQSCLNSIKSSFVHTSISSTPSPLVTETSMKKEAEVVVSKPIIPSPVSKIAEAVYKESEQVVVKVVVAAENAVSSASSESKQCVYRFRVGKEDFGFSDLKKVIEERTTQLKNEWKLQYQDDENEWITVKNQLEWEEAKRVCKDLVRLHVA